MVTIWNSNINLIIRFAYHLICFNNLTVTIDIVNNIQNIFIASFRSTCFMLIFNNINNLNRSLTINCQTRDLTVNMIIVWDNNLDVIAIFTSNLVSFNSLTVFINIVNNIQNIFIASFRNTCLMFILNHVNCLYRSFTTNC